MIYKKLFAVSVSCESAHAVIYGNDIRIKAVDKKIKGVKRGYRTAGGNIYINAEGSDGIAGMVFGIGMDRDMAFIKMSGNCFPVFRKKLSSQIAGGVDLLGQPFFRYQERHACALRVIILLGNIKHRCADHFRDATQYIRKTLGIILLVYIGDIILLLAFRFCIAYVIYIEAEGFCQIIEAIKDRGALPILVSSNGWLTDFNSESAAHEYTYTDKSFIAETKELAEKYNLTYVNLHDISATYFSYIGFDAAESLYWINWSGDRDTIHPNRNGAGHLARMLIEDLIRQGYKDFAYYLDGYGVSKDLRLKCNIDSNNLMKLENTMPYNLTLTLITNYYNQNGAMVGTTAVPVTIPKYDVLNPNTTVDIQLPASNVRAFLVGYGINQNVFDSYNNYYDTPNNAAMVFLP